jgi:hypothetical protein
MPVRVKKSTTGAGSDSGKKAGVCVCVCVQAPLFLAKLTWYPRIEVDLGVVAKRRVVPLLGLSDPLGH